MSLQQKHYIRAILTNESFDHRDMIASTMNRLFEQSDLPMVSKMSVMLLLLGENLNKPLSEQLDYIKKNFKKVIEIIHENNIKLPEEEVMLKNEIDAIHEEGEMNVTAGIDPQTPRIKPRKTPHEEDTEECQVQK